MVVVCLIVATLMPAARSWACDPNRPLAVQPDLLQGSLRNGFAYLIKERRQPAGESALCLVVRAGSMHEPEGASGVAVLRSRLPFAAGSGTARAKEALFGLGVPLERGRNAMVDFDATMYTVALPRTDRESLRLALSFLAGAVDPDSVDDGAVNAERELRVADERGQLNVQQRLIDQVFPRLLPGSILADHPPNGRAGAALAIAAPSVRQFSETWYRPSRMTLIAVGDVDGPALIEALTAAFGGMADGAGPDDPPLGLSQTKPVAMVVRDPGIRGHTPQIMSFDGIAEAQRTEGCFRERLVDDLAAEAFQRRLARKALTGELDASYALAGSVVAFGRFKLSYAVAAGPDRPWKDQVCALVGEVARARAHGFSPGEIGEARAAIRSLKERRARSDAAGSSADLAWRLSEDIRRGSIPLSGPQHLELTSRIMPTIHDEEIHRAFERLYDPSRSAFVFVTGADEAGVPSEVDLDTAVRAAHKAAYAADPEWAPPGTMLVDEPVPGTIARMTIDPGTDTLSARLGNGVTVHHRLMDDRDGMVHIVVTLAGGRIAESRATRGLSEAALLAWQTPSAQSRSAAEIASLRAGSDIALGATIRDDAVRLTLSADVSELDEALRLAHMLLREPRIDAREFEQWRWRIGLIEHYRAADPARRTWRLLDESLAPSPDRRGAPLSAEEAGAIDLSAAQGWLDQLAANGSLEVAIVGGVRRGEALQLAARYFGSLPARACIGPGTLARERTVAPARGGAVRAVNQSLSSAHGAALVGRRAGAVMEETTDAHLLEIAAAILQRRLTAAMRDERRMVARVETRARPCTALAAHAFIAALVVAEPSRLEEASQELEREFARLAAEAPSAEEFAAAARPVMHRLEMQPRGSVSWAESIAESAYRGRSIAEISQAAARSRDLGPEDVRTLMARLGATDGAITLVARPPEPAAPPADVRARE